MRKFEFCPDHIPLEATSSSRCLCFRYAAALLAEDKAAAKTSLLCASYSLFALSALSFSSRSIDIRLLSYDILLLLLIEVANLSLYTI